MLALEIHRCHSKLNAPVRRLAQRAYPWQSVEVRVRVRASLGAVDHIQISQWEVQAGSKGLDARPKGTFGERRQLVE